MHYIKCADENIVFFKKNKNKIEWKGEMNGKEALEFAKINGQELKIEECNIEEKIEILNSIQRVKYSSFDQEIRNAVDVEMDEIVSGNKDESEEDVQRQIDLYMKIEDGGLKMKLYKKIKGKITYI